MDCTTPEHRGKDHFDEHACFRNLLGRRSHMLRRLHTKDHVLHNLRDSKSHETIQICRLTISSRNPGACARYKIRLSTSREGESPSCNTRKREVQRRSHSTLHSTEETKVDTADCAETIQASTAQIVKKRGSLFFSLTISCPFTDGRSLYVMSSAHLSHSMQHCCPASTSGRQRCSAAHSHSQHTACPGLERQTRPNNSLRSGLGQSRALHNALLNLSQQSTTRQRRGTMLRLLFFDRRSACTLGSFTCPHNIL